MNENNVLKFHSIGKLLRYLNVNFGDQNKKQTVQNKIRILKKGNFFFAEYLTEFQQYIKNTGFDIDNQKKMIGCSWELQKLLVDTILIKWRSMKSFLFVKYYKLKTK